MQKGMPLVEYSPLQGQHVHSGILIMLCKHQLAITFLNLEVLSNKA